MDLLDKVEQTREKMIISGQTLGFTDLKTIALSQELDTMIIEEQTRRMNK